MFVQQRVEFFQFVRQVSFRVLMFLEFVLDFGHEDLELIGNLGGLFRSGDQINEEAGEKEGNQEFGFHEECILEHLMRLITQKNTDIRGWQVYSRRGEAKARPGYW